MCLESNMLGVCINSRNAWRVINSVTADPMVVPGEGSRCAGRVTQSMTAYPMVVFGEGSICARRVTQSVSV